MIRNQIKDVTMIVFGNICMAFGYAKFMVPNKIINGGITSFSQIINQYINIDIPTINNWLLTILLLIILFFLGKEVFLKSVLSSIVYSLCFTLFYNLSWTMSTSPILDLLIASILISFGYYACLSSNSSTVGVDVIALVIKKYFVNTNISNTIKWLNYSILFIGLITFGLWSIILGTIFTFIYSYELNFLLQKKQYIKNLKNR